MPRTVEIVCLCGSMRFAAELRSVSYEQSLAGAIVLAPAIAPLSATTEKLSREQRAMLSELHLRKIDLADRVLVVNPGGYIGETTRKEIAYARSLRKPVAFLEPTADPCPERPADEADSSVAATHAPVDRR